MSGSPNAMNTTASSVVCAVAVLITACTGRSCNERSPGAHSVTWQVTKELVRTTFPDAPQVSVEALAETLSESTSPLLIDVREDEEYAVSHLPGAVSARGSELERLVSEAGEDRVILLYCSVGYRSSREVEKLRAKGFGNVSNLEGSIFEWANAGHPLVRGGPESQTPTDAVHPFNDLWGVLLDPERRSYAPR